MGSGAATDSAVFGDDLDGPVRGHPQEPRLDNGVGGAVPWGKQQGQGLQSIDKLLIERASIAINDEMQFPIGRIVEAAGLLQELFRELIESLMQAFTISREAMQAVAGIDKNQAFHLGFE